jgi:hypothetical protein
MMKELWSPVEQEAGFMNGKNHFLFITLHNGGEEQRKLMNQLYVHIVRLGAKTQDTNVGYLTSRATLIFHRR